MQASSNFTHDLRQASLQTHSTEGHHSRVVPKGVRRNRVARLDVTRRSKYASPQDRWLLQWRDTRWALGAAPLQAGEPAATACCDFASLKCACRSQPAQRCAVRATMCCCSCPTGAAAACGMATLAVPAIRESCACSGRHAAAVGRRTCFSQDLCNPDTAGKLIACSRLNYPLCR